MIITLLDTWGRQVLAEIVVGRHTVELWCRDVIVGVGSREYLHNWLRDPVGAYAYDEMMWMSLGGFGVALAIDDVVPAWPLSDAVVENLRAYV